MRRSTDVKRLLAGVGLLLVLIVLLHSMSFGPRGASSSMSSSHSASIGVSDRGSSHSLSMRERRDEARQRLAGNRSDQEDEQQGGRTTSSPSDASSVTNSSIRGNTSAPVIPCRLVALGDIHGDFVYMRRALRAAKLIDRNGVWVGGCATLVQTGDVVDRGEESIRCLKELERLKKQADEYGGKVITLLGNHELMNIMGHTNYAHPFEVAKLGGEEAWRHQFSKGGPFWNRFLLSPIAVVIEGTVFVHGGILPEFARMGIKHINALARQALVTGKFDVNVFSDAGPLWTRDVINHAKLGSCGKLASTLELLGATRMVIGHTVQEDGHVHGYCDGKLVAIDTGLSRALLGSPAALELQHDGTTVPIYPTG